MEFATTPSFANIASDDRLWGPHQQSLDKVRANEMQVVFDLVYIFLAQNVPITAWGPVGVGKTQKTRDLIYQLDENEHPYQVLTIAPSTEDPTAFHGVVYTSLAEDNKTTVMRRSMPEIVKHVLDYARSEFVISGPSGERVETTLLNALPVIGENEQIVSQTKVGGLTILFLDEMTTCMPAQQHALLGLLTHAEYGGVDISPYIVIFMAANPPGTVSTVNDLGEQVMNRGGHVPWYGDRKLWFDGWSTGFGRPEREPDSFAVSLVEEVFQDSTAQNSAFRHEDWSPDQLVPYDRIQHTPRTMDQFGQVGAFVKRRFSEIGTDESITNFYIERVALALLGHEWQARVSGALQRLKDRVSPDAVIDRVRHGNDLTLDLRADDFALMLAQGLGDELNRAPDNAPLRSDQQMAMANDLIARVTRKGGFSKDAYIAAWVFLVSTGDLGVISGFRTQIVQLMTLAQHGVKIGALEPKAAVPAFLSEDVRGIIRSMKESS